MIKNSYPPSRAEMKNAPGKLSIAFSNTIYLNIIWRFSSTTMHYLCLYDWYCKMSHVSIFDVLLFHKSQQHSFTPVVTLKRKTNRWMLLFPLARSKAVSQPKHSLGRFTSSSKIILMSSWCRLDHQDNIKTDSVLILISSW